MHHNYRILKQNVNKIYRKKSIYFNDQCFFFDIMKQACMCIIDHAQYTQTL